MTNSKLKELAAADKMALLTILKKRFEAHPQRHPGMQWSRIESRIGKSSDALWRIHEMERTGGEPDVCLLDADNDHLVFVDFSSESPKERRSLCYDQHAHASRKENKPKSSAHQMAEEMGIQLLTESEYRTLQRLEQLDLKTSSWVQTPENIRTLGGAIFCDRRYETVFTYHNGAESYYASRGFRGCVKI